MNNLISKISRKTKLKQSVVRKINFDVSMFAKRHLNLNSLQLKPKPVKKTHQDQDVSMYISSQWRVLERKTTKNKGSLIALPNSYIVPGGRFDEQFYWDSYFTMLGLASEERWDMIENMISNYNYMIQKFGHIPNANRSYFLSRSQPPFFSHMIRLLSNHKGKSVIVDNLDYLLKEYQFWMEGIENISRQNYKSFARVVEMDNGVFLNRYHDDKYSPRDEEIRNDIDLGLKFEKNGDKKQLYSHLRSAAESGWDFSSRWFKDPNDICTIHTTDLIPIDLNCLIYHLELTISEAYSLKNNTASAEKFRTKAADRASAISEYCWDDNSGMFMDYDFHEKQTTGRLTLASVFALFVGIASDEQAARVADVIKKDFLKDGGLVTTLINSSQQWDYPNGWAPLQYISIKGLINYGYEDLANEIKKRWIKTNLSLFDSNGKLFEKYNVVDCGNLAVGGEYVLQVGFGWTNGVLEALLKDKNI